MKFRLYEVPKKELAITEEGKPIFTYHYGGTTSPPYFHPVYAPNGEVVTADGDVGQQYPQGFCFTWGTLKASSEDSAEEYKAWLYRRDIVTPKPTPECSTFHLLSMWKLPATSKHLVPPADVAQLGSLALVFLELFTVTVYPLQETDPRHSDAVSIENFSQSGNKNPGVRVFDVNVSILGAKVNLTLDGSTGLSYHAADMEYPKAVDAEGRIGVAEVNGTAAKWCALGGIVANDPIGIAIIPHPANGETRFVAEDTGRGFLKVQTPPLTLEADESLALQYRVLVYVGDLFTVDVLEYYQDYIKTDKNS